ncbi:MAG: thiamine diphosphokinase [Eubacteriales bacterium]|nr:thiamine diphosphokinase [Eubacteriales bacterium]
MKKCAIITSYIEGNLKELLPEHENCFIIAADGGVKHAADYDIPLDLIIGDFDSYKGELPTGVPVIKVPTEKDDTDSGISVSYAIDNGFNDIIIIGGIGGRLDHTIANLQIMGGASLKGVNIEMRSKGNFVRALNNGTITLESCSNCSFSIFSLTDCCEGVNIKNSRYDLKNHTLTASFPLGCSNEFAAESVEISVEKGILLIIVSSK